MLQTEGLNLRIEDALILEDISLEVKRAEFVSILGPNGSGKTSLLRCLLGLVPFEGKVLLKQKEIQHYARRDLGRILAYIPQIVEKLPSFSVEEFVLMGRFAYQAGFFGYSTKDKEVVDEALRLTDTETFRDRNVSTLSGGERQRVLVAAALAQEPEMVLLDEPASFLDPLHEVEFYRLLKELHQEKQITIIVVSHDINRSVLASDRILALKSGKLAFDGSPKEFMNEENLRSIFDTPFSLVAHPDSDCLMSVVGQL